MGLIDADELISVLGFENTQEERDENVGEIITLEDIDRIPTACDLDKVVEQLEKEKNPLYREDGSMMGERTAIRIDKAIEIVKGGGIGGDQTGFI